MILLNPGPVNLSQGVREALTKPDLCHREPEFTELQTRIRQHLLAVYGLAETTWAAVLLAGSGTAAVEAMITSLVPAQSRLLVLENGVYGERMSRIAAIHGISYRSLHHAWGESLDLSAVERGLASAGTTHVAVVHHETTTGRLNDLQALGALCQTRGIPLLVDGVSSFGAEALDFTRGGIGACAATANKCLHGAPGVSFAVVRRDLLAVPDIPQRSLYLDLAVYCRDQDDGGTPFTQPVQLFYALDQALWELEREGGWRARREHYRALAHRVRQGLIGLGVKPLLPERETSVVLSAYHLPENKSYRELHDALKARGFVIYAGQGRLARNIFRISTMGAMVPQDIEDLLLAFRQVLS